MKQSDRPTQIITLLETICSGDNGEIGAELETYIAELEAKQPDRPPAIRAILRAIEAQYPADIGTLESYIARLERVQPLVVPDDTTTAVKSAYLPVWSHERGVQREQHRQERALRKHNNYQ